MTKFIPSSEFIRYVISGGINTGTSYVIYLLFLLALPYSIAYALAYLCGIGVSYYLNSRFVFRQPLHWKKAIRFPLVYALQFSAGLVLLSIFVERLHASEIIAPILVVLCTLPVTFLLSRRIIKGRPA